MFNSINKNKIHQMQNNWYTWRNNAGTATMVLLSFAVACFTGCMAQVAILTPWSPVVITFQTFAVLLAGAFLGSRYGGLSMILYMVLGVLGVPWFTHMQGGIAGILSASGGYLFGFVIAAVFTGYIFDNYENMRKPVQSVLVMLFANWVLIYIPGLIGLYHFMAQTQTVTLTGLLLAGVLPFLFGDALKVLLASGISTSILPKEE